MKTILGNERILQFERKLKKWFNKTTTKYASYIFKGIKKFLKICKLYNKNDISLNNLIKKYYCGKQAFYIWKNKAIAIMENNWNFELAQKQSTKPKNINYKYNEEYRKTIASLIKKFQTKYGAGIYEFYYLTKTGFIKFNDKPVRHNIKTLIRWNKFFNKEKCKNKKQKKHPRYEVSKLGLIQHDIKVLTRDLTGLNKNYYVFDFIDEKSRFAVAYIYDAKGANNAIGSTKKAIEYFASIGIKVSRIRTDNGSEYVNNLYRNERLTDSEYTTFLNKKGIVHETTPIASPQSNGKIERFHQNWNKFFSQVQIVSLNELRKYSKIFLEYYNTIRPHKSLGLKTPKQMVQTLID